MFLDILHRLVIGLISGLTEFLPVSAHPHQNIYSLLTKFELKNEQWLKACVLIGCFAALVLSLRKSFKEIHDDKKLYRNLKRKRTKTNTPMGVLTARLYKLVMIPMLLSLLFYGMAQQLTKENLPAMVILLLINGFILILPRLLPTSLKDGRTMTKLDAIVMGIGGAVGIIPCLSRIGCGCALGEAKGGKPSYVLNIMLLATVWPLGLQTLFSVLGAFTQPSYLELSQTLANIGAAVLSFAGAFAGIRFLRWFVEKLGLYKFAFYSWVFCLVVFILIMFV